MSIIDIDSRFRLSGQEGWRISVLADISQVKSALIHDDCLQIEISNVLGIPQFTLNVGLWQGFNDVLSAIQLQAKDPTDPSGWRYIELEFARGTPDLTPVKLPGTKGDDALYGGLGADLLKGGKDNDILHGERQSDNPWVGGDDKLAGGNGDDILSGGGGQDIFQIHLQRGAISLLNNEPRSNHDRITDFGVGEDKIGLLLDQATSSDLQIEIQSAEGKVSGLDISFEAHAATNSLNVQFSELFTQAEFDTLITDAGSLNALVVEVV